MWPLLSLLLSFNFIAVAWGSCPLKDGDLVYIKSRSSQSALLKIATSSEWTHTGMAFKNKTGWEIIEAVQPVKWTGIKSFISRSNEFHFEVHRPLFTFDAKKVKKHAVAQLGKNYDLIFGWENERWYCSELTYKAYERGAEQQIGDLELVGDLNVDEPSVIKEASRRFQNYGMEFNLEAWKKTSVITPVEMMRSDKVEKIYDHTSAALLKDCMLKKKR